MANTSFLETYENRIRKLAIRQVHSGAIKPRDNKIVLRFNSRDQFERFSTVTGCGTNLVYGFGCIYCFLDTSNIFAVATAVAQFNAYIPWVRISHKHFKSNSELCLSLND
jgi:hypothetical protein